MTRIQSLLLVLLIPACIFGQTPTEQQAIENRDKYLYAVSCSQKRFTDKIPFDDYDLSQIFITVLIQGKPYLFLYDTGAITIISDEIREALNLDLLYQNKMVDASNITHKETFYKLDDLTIGTTKFKNIGVASQNLDKFSQKMCLQIDGILGSNIIRTLNWKIDYKNKQLIFSDKKIKPSTPSNSFHFEENFSGSPILVLILGEYNFKTTFDTGNNMDFNLPNALFFTSYKSKTNPLESGYGLNTLTLYNTKDYDTTFIGRLDSLYINKKLYQNQLIWVNKNTSPLLGNNFLKQYDEVIINYSKGLIYIPQTISKQSKETTFGFSTEYQNGKIIVCHLWNHSEASNKGLQLGDTITKINEVNLEHITDKEWCDIKKTYLLKTETITIETSKKKKYSLDQYNL